MKKDNSQFRQWLSDTRRDFHTHQETSHQETPTTAKIAAILKKLGCEASAFDDLTGAVGLIKGNSPGLAIGLRADIDALPIQQLNDVSYKSQNPGAMNACGHDAHTAIMLGVAINIRESRLQAKLKGNVKFFFQLAEERVAGGIRLKVFDRLHEIVDGLEKMFSVDCRLQIHEGVPTLENDIEVADFL